MKAGTGLFLISLVAGIFSWVLNAFFNMEGFSPPTPSPLAR